MNLYKVINPIYKISNLIGMAPFKMKNYKNITIFQIKTYKTELLRMFLYLIATIAAVTVYISGTHRTPMMSQNNNLKYTENLTNRILLYFSDCSGYITVLMTYFYQFYKSEKATKAMRLLFKIKNKFNYYNINNEIKNKKMIYIIASILFMIDITLKFYDTFYLVYTKRLSMHGVFEHVIRYIFITIMDLLILQWICYMNLIRVYFESLLKLLKIIKHQNCWVIDFKTTAILKDIGIIYDYLCTFSKYINSVYDLPILLIISICFTITTFSIFLFCKLLHDEIKINHVMTFSYLSNVLRIAGLITPAIYAKQVVDKFVEQLHCLDFDNVKCLKTVS